MADGKEAMRRMEYPYTSTAKLLNFPYKFYFTKQWIWKTYPIGAGLVALLFWKINKGVNSEENVAKWKEIRRQDRVPHLDQH